MLAALENFLRPAIEAALGEVATRLGPELPGNAGAVVVHARRLEVAPIGSDEGADSTPHVQTIHDWPVEPGRLDYVLGDGIVGEIIEVESPPGFTLRAGDAYYLDDQTIRFYRPPSGPVRARIQGAVAFGWARRRVAALELELSGWATSLVEADRRLQVASTTALAELARVPNLELESEQGEVWLRMIVSRVSVRACTRERVDALLRSTMIIDVAGELDELVAPGEPQPVSTIRAIAGRVATLGRGPAQASEVALGDGTGLASSASPRPRAIESKELRVLASLNAAMRSSLLARGLESLGQLAAQDSNGLPADLRPFVERARLLLAVEPPLPLPPTLAHTSIASLLASSSATLATTLDVSRSQADSLLDTFALMPLLLTRSALGQLVVGDWLTRPALELAAQPLAAHGIRFVDLRVLRSVADADRNALRAAGIDRLAELAEIDADALALQLPGLGLVQLRQLSEQAGRVIAAIDLAEIPNAAGSSTLANLLALPELALAQALAFGPAEAHLLRAQLSTLQVLLKDSAFSSLTLREWVPTSR